MTEMPDIRRILVALDASAHSAAALRAAAELAATMQAELLGMFVEDINLLRLAELPGAQEIVLATRSARALDTRRLERALRQQAAELERELMQTLQGMSLRGGFRVVRGQVVQELLAAAEQADLLVVGRVGCSLLQRARLGSTARALAATASHTVVFLEHGASLGPPVLVVFDGSEGASRALATALRLLPPKDERLVVLIPAQEPKRAQHLQTQATEWLTGRGRRARFRPVGADVSDLAGIVRQEGGNALVLPADCMLAREEVLPGLMDQVRCPVVLAR